jgi:hypothetical protein
MHIKFKDLPEIIFMKKKLQALAILILVFNYCIGQSSSLYSSDQDSMPQKRKLNFVLVDHKTGAKFVLDSARQSISAVARNGKLLWQTNPEKVSGPDFIYGDGAKIIYCYFDTNARTRKERIIVEYNINLIGSIDKKTGKFTFLGRD